MRPTKPFGRGGLNFAFSDLARSALSSLAEKSKFESLIAALPFDALLSRPIAKLALSLNSVGSPAASVRSSFTVAPGTVSNALLTKTERMVSAGILPDRRTTLSSRSALNS